MALPERGPPEQGLAHLFVTTVQQRSLSQRLRVGLLEAEGVSGFENIEARARGRSFVDDVKQRDHARHTACNTQIVPSTGVALSRTHGRETKSFG